MGLGASDASKPTDENLESLSLIWLDATVDNSKENLNVQKQLRSVINFLKTFHDANECENYIRSIPEDDRILFIVSGGLGQYIVPRIYTLRKILAIYIFCYDKKKHEGWSKQFTKVKGLFTEKQDLVSRIQADRVRRKKGDEPFLFTIQGQSTSELNGEFVHSQIFLDVLLRIPPHQADKDEFIARCNKTYRGNDTELAVVNEFNKKYSTDKALWWYTRESFVYRMLNKALRVQNIDVLFLFRFFIKDIEQQLKMNQCTSTVQLYRGQHMSNDEIQMLQNSVNKFISINSFLSTSLDRYVALNFLEDRDGLEQVLFEIEANPSVTSKPFADITKFSYFRTEKEVLIMVGSICRILSVTQDGSNVWTIRMTLCSDNDSDLRIILEHMKNEHGGGDKNLLSFGNVLADMGKFDAAEKYYLRLLKSPPSDKPDDIARCYHGLGNVTDEQGNYESSLQWHEKSLALRQLSLKTDHPHLAPSYISIGCAHFNKGEYDQALISYTKAYDIIKRAYGENHPDLGMCLNNMGCVYERQKNYPKALECHEKALAIRKEYLPENHPDVGQSHHNIGNIYREFGQLDVALQHYNQSLQIKIESLPIQHRDIALTLENIGNIYKDKDHLQEALAYYKKAAIIYHHSLPSTHPSVLQIDEYIKYLS